jgi:DNA-binding protein YbaB
VNDYVPTRAVERVRADHERLRADLISLRQSISEIAETAYSPDGLVKVTVGESGRLTELVLDPRIYRKTDATALAATITATIHAAVAAANARMVEVTKPFLPDEIPLLDDDSEDGLGRVFDPMLRHLDGQLDGGGRDGRA